MRKIGKSLAVLAAAVALPLTLSGTAEASIPFGKEIKGKATYYDDSGYGACGTRINADREMLVAVPAAYWTTSNPNKDPLCKNVSVEVTYKGKTIKVPVKDQCPSCDSKHIDLSRAAFARLADTDLGRIDVTWKFVRS
ncbi:Rare lipoprotein A (RlpA)-like double-psi beta-barrel [Streptoalloteichus tenebrarius]|uniref:Rare lipoprotein A (RlpA)-like double-psi beta-barrel n=1 Tax=Streptoalloteichus tenebrarius (strain ATCC 17920 / DSM 40477 / JCM 4838 / CBS 697.72 / NBRC 16177 / NCIMB 11028 / NRRL B-12390 / A12253. 1 / ISP 5477) TaxID=1933 RepID=A0ABT1I3P1_STRSD|nr:cysteine/serine endopeptidase inhibitor [Streptoalloteichus tenebrarius]MCP2262190.1 Rare lipoprotein A (RlpA)-like double-psi beta-barrel [Streptoalloteichus tenebrarius]BFE98972.1 RlpA-like double-psi beta-barrel domain-containing protein [Streptoalloteichus tenebrarius]